MSKVKAPKRIWVNLYDGGSYGYAHPDAGNARAVSNNLSTTAEYRLVKPKAKKKDPLRWRKNKGVCPKFKKFGKEYFTVELKFSTGISRHHFNPEILYWKLHGDTSNIIEWRYVK
jgi:hypothetical protein